MEILIQIGAGIIAFIAIIVFFKSQSIKKRPTWSDLILKFILAGISAGICIAGVLIIGGLKNLLEIFVFAVLAGLVGALSVLLSWGSYEIYSWIHRRRLEE